MKPAPANAAPAHPRRRGRSAVRFLVPGRRDAPSGFEPPPGIPGAAGDSCPPLECGPREHACLVSEVPRVQLLRGHQRVGRHIRPDTPRVRCCLLGATYVGRDQISSARTQRLIDRRPMCADEFWPAVARRGVAPFERGRRMLTVPAPPSDEAKAWTAKKCRGRCPTRVVWAHRSARREP